MDQSTVDAYLQRIGAGRPRRPDIEALRHLQERHVLTVPFENLYYYLGEPVPLDESILEKVVHKRRGGGCYEVNPAFSYLLRDLGFEVDLLPAQVYINGELGVPLGHVVIRVRLDGTSWLVDVGFGRNSRRPLSLDTPGVQEDPHGAYEVVALPDGGYELLMNGTKQCRIGDRPIRPEELRATLWWYRTCSASPFLQGQLCTLPTENGRVTLTGRTLTRQEGGERTTEELRDDAEVIEAYRKYFGIDIDEIPSDLVVDAAGAVRVRSA